MHAEIDHFLPLLSPKKIRFRNRVQLIFEETLVVVLIKLSYPNRYWQMIDCFGYSRTLLSIIFNDTIIYLYYYYQKKFTWDNKRLTYKKLLSYAMIIHNFDKKS